MKDRTPTYFRSAVFCVLSLRPRLPRFPIVYQREIVLPCQMLRLSQTERFSFLFLEKMC